MIPWWNRKEEEETHFLDTLVNEIKVEEPHYLDEVIKGIEEPEEEPHILDQTIKTIEIGQEEKKDYWWLPAWQKAQEAYTWMYPHGWKTIPEVWRPVLETAGYKIGDAATVLARLCPGEDDLPPYQEQSLPRQAFTLAQASSVIALGTLIGATGISALSSLTRYLAYGKVDKIASEFAKANFKAIKAQNPQVRTLQDAESLTQSSLRMITAPKIETTYLPTTMNELTKLSRRLLTPLTKQAATAEFNRAMVEQVRAMLSESGAEPTTKMLEPFTQTIAHFVGSPIGGMVKPEYGAAVVDAINKNLPSMVEDVIKTGKAELPFKPIIPDKPAEEAREIEEIVDTAMREKPLTLDEIYAEAREAYLKLDKFIGADEADKATVRMSLFNPKTSEWILPEDWGYVSHEALAEEAKGRLDDYVHITETEMGYKFIRDPDGVLEATGKLDKAEKFDDYGKTADFLISKGVPPETTLSIMEYPEIRTLGDISSKAPTELFPEEEIAPTKQMEMYRSELKRLEEAGITGKEAEKAALKTAGLKYKPKGIAPTPEQLKWELGKPTLKGQKELELRPEPGTPEYIEWWKKLPTDQQDAEILRKKRPELERLVTSELEEMRTEVEAGKPGRRVRTETGEWMAEPSTYPDFVGEFGLTKKGILKAYKTKKGKTWDLLQDIARDRVALGYEHPRLGRVEPAVSKAESDYLLQMREISKEIPEKIIVNEQLGIAEAKKEMRPGELITEKDYAHLAGKYDGQKNPVDLTQWDKETLWMQEVDRELNSPLTKEQLTELQERMDGLKIIEKERDYFVRAMTNRTNKLTELTQEEAILMNNYLAGLPEYDPDLPIPTISPPESTPGMPTNWQQSLLDMTQNMESWAERMEAKYPNTKMFTNILYPTIQARRKLYQLRIKLAKKGLEAVKGLTKDEMREIQDWAEEEAKGIEHTITLNERQEKARAELLEGINEIADLVEVAEEERVPGKGYMPRRYRKEFLERLGIRTRKYDFSPMPWDYLRTPKSFKPFFKYERTIEDAPKSARLDLFSSYMQYVNSGTQSYFRDVLEDTAKDIDRLPPKLKAYMRRWANLQAGTSGIGEQLFVNTLGEMHVPKETALMIERYLMDAGYMGGLGLKVSFAAKNATQFLHGLSEVDEKWVLYGLYKMATKEGKEIWQKSGCQMHYGPYLARSLPKAKGKYQKAKNGMMIFVSTSDQLNREPIYLADYYRTMHYGKLYQEGKIDWTDVVRKLDLKRYEEPFQDIVKRHLEKGENEIAADLMGDRVQAYTNWRYWSLCAPMLLAEGGPLSRQFATWGFDNVDLMWRRRIERGTKLIKQGEVKAGTYQFGKILRHLLYLGILGAAIGAGAKRITGKEYKVGPMEIIRYLTLGSIPSGLAPVPETVVNALQFGLHSLSGRDWLAAQKWGELKRRARVFIPAGLSFRDWYEAIKKEAPGEAAMRIIFPQFTPETTAKKRRWYEPTGTRPKTEKRRWFEPAGTKKEGEKKKWYE